MKRLFRWVVWCGLILLLGGCGRNDRLLPTAVLQPIEQILPTQSPTAVPTLTVSPSSTAVSITPTPLPSPTPKLTVTLQPKQVETKVRISSPAAGDDIVVDQPLTISGEANPVPEDKLLIRVLAVGGDELVRETAVVQADGTWTLTTTIPPQIAGSAQLVAQLEFSQNAVAIQLNLLPNDTGTTITMNRPANGGKVVAGYAVLFDGIVSQPLNETVVMAIQTADCKESHTSNSITLPNGRWQGWSRLEPTVTAGAGCAIAFTGERGTESAREVRVPITILDKYDTQARSLQLGNSGEQVAIMGTSAYFYGVAIQAPNNEVNVQIVPDSTGTSNKPIAQGTAVVNSIGFWEVHLEIPADIQSQQAILMVTMGEDENYHEVREIVFIQAGENPTK